MPSYLVQIGIREREQSLVNILVLDAKDENEAEWEALDELRRNDPEVIYKQIYTVKSVEINYTVSMNPSKR